MNLLVVALVIAAATPETPAADQEGRYPVEATAGLGKGLALRTADGELGLDLKARMQLRALTLVAPDGLTDGPDADKIAFAALVRRARLTVAGFALHKLVTFNLQLGLAPLDLEPDLPVPVRDAWVSFNFAPAFNLKVGQMKAPYDRQRITGSSSLEFADRIAVTNELTLDRDVGAQLYATDLFGLDGRVTYAVGLFAGDGRNRFLPDPGLLAVVHLQVSPLGKFDDLEEGDLERREDPRLAVAGSLAYNSRARREKGTFGNFFAEGSSVDYAHGELDAVFKWAGLAVSGAVLARTAVLSEGSPTGRSAVGAYLQGGYMLSDSVELVARAGRLEPLPDSLSATPSTLTAATELDAGANLYIVGHAMKIQSDVGWEPDLEHPTLSWRLQTQLTF